MLNKQIKSQTILALFDKPYPLQSGDEISHCKHEIKDKDVVLSKHFEW